MSRDFPFGFLSKIKAGIFCDFLSAPMKHKLFPSSGCRCGPSQTPNPFCNATEPFSPVRWGIARRLEQTRLNPFELKKRIERKLKNFFTHLGNLDRESMKA